MARRAPPTADSIACFNEICTMRIELVDSDPLIWRVLEVPTSMTLLALNEAIQIAIGWENSHLWEFAAGKRRYGPRFGDDRGEASGADAGIARLRDLLGRGIREVLYTYDFGNNWERRLSFSDIRQGETGRGYPCFVAGERAGPPEDCGGIGGFREMLDAMRDPSHPDHEEIANWLGEYDPEDIDQVRLEIGLRGLAARRNAQARRLAKPE